MKPELKTLENVKHILLTADGFGRKIKTQTLIKLLCPSTISEKEFALKIAAEFCQEEFEGKI
jgi:hypothetical protein